jgi:hypothetical protein
MTQVRSATGWGVFTAASSVPRRFTRRARSTDRICPGLIADCKVRPFPLLCGTATSTGYGVGDTFEVTAATVVTELYRLPASFRLITAGRVC